MSLLNSSQNFKNAEITLGSQFLKCSVCGEVTSKEVVLMIKDGQPRSTTCICKKCIGEANEFLNKKR